MPGFLSDLFGSRPKLPPAPKPIDLGKQQQLAIDTNIAAEPSARAFAGLIEDQIDAMIRRNVPGWDNIKNLVSENTQAQLRGELPQSDVAQSQLDSVARSFGLGTGGSGFGGNLVARDLGLRQLDLTNRGLASAESWLNATEQLYNPALIQYNRMFISPEQQYAATKTNEDTAFQYQYLKNQIAAMPDPQTVGVMSLLNGTSLLSTVYGGKQGYQGSPQLNTGGSGGVTNSDVGWNTYDESWAGGSGIGEGASGAAGGQIGVEGSTTAAGTGGGGY